MRSILTEMINIYKPNGIDWMGYKMTKNNPYTFHHIQESRNRGNYDINNGAILTKDAHEYLNYLDSFCPEAYEEYQKIFRFINSLNGPIPDYLYQELYEDIYYLAYEIECLGKYEFLEIPRDERKEKKLKRKEEMMKNRKRRKEKNR